jgi:hypothetical protein
VNGTGPVRREGFLDARATAALLEEPAALDIAPVLAVAADFFGPLNNPQTRVLTLAAGDAVAALLPENAQAGFLLDLDPSDWRSEWGGLLLFHENAGRVHGFRPVTGALTLFSATDRPLISLITPQGSRRTSILGWWR